MTIHASPFEVAVDGGLLRGSVQGQGEPVLLLHGGPGLPWSYLQPVVEELSDGYTVATYQQRGLPPSTARAPYDVPTQVRDVVAVLDTIGWSRAVVVGHSWGGHLLLHVLAAFPGRLTAALVIDPLGGVGDGGEQQFEGELFARTPPGDVKRAAELDRRALAGEGTEADMTESLRLVWPAYFADRSAAPPMPDVRGSVEAYSETYESIHAELPSLAARLGNVTVPTTFLHGAASPMPVTASTDTAAAIGSAATVQVLEGAGHFVWIERPGSVRTALDGLLRR